MSTEMLKDALDFDLIADVFVTESITASPSELHGQLCGYLASGVALPLEDWLTMVVEFCDIDRKSTRLNSSHPSRYRMPSSA